MKPPRKAIILAAGFGTRLLPLTLIKPKPLFPLWGKPVLGHALDLLKSWGVEEVLVNAHHHAGEILTYLQTRAHEGVQCQLSYEPEILGTGGALVKARWFLDDEPFWMLNADVLAELSPQPLLKAHAKHHAIATLWLHPDRGPRTVEHRNGMITNFKSQAPGSAGTATFCGLQLLSPAILDYLPPTGFSSIVTAYQQAMKTGKKVAGVVIENAYWADIGTPESYLATHEEMLQLPRWKHFGKTGMPFVSKGIGSKALPGASITRSVLWDQVTLVPGAQVVNSIISDGVKVHSPVDYMAIRADQLPDPDISRIISKLKWDPIQTTVMPLTPRGSARTFTRLVSDASSTSKSVIVIRYKLERPENALYTAHTRFLARHGVSVPAVLMDWPDEHITVMEDVGTTSLEQLVPTLKRSHCLAVYKQTLETVARLHTEATRAALRRPLKLSMPFTRHLYEWEQNLFCEQFLSRHGRVTAAQLGEIRRELSRLIPAQVRAPRVIIHRDLQSSNVLIRDGKAFLIDFQGMRFGTAAYDLASLLCDPYVNLSDDIREELLEYYLGLIPDSQAVRDLFWIAAVERLAQALGAFGRLGAIPATSYFLKRIPSGVMQLQNAINHLPGLPVLKSCLAIFPAIPAPEMSGTVHSQDSAGKT